MRARLPVRAGMAYGGFAAIPMNAMTSIRAEDANSARRAAVRSARRAARRLRRQMLVRGGALAAAIAIPSFAAQGEWSDFSRAIGITPAQAATVPMPFETAGLSFPGSAFYYLEDEPRLAYDLAELRKEEGTLETQQFAESHGAGAAAQAFRIAGSGLDKARALQCLSMAVYYEAASESVAGQQAVAQVVLNRVAHPAYPSSVCGVVFQGSERQTGCQFSFTCDGSLARHPSRGGWARAQSVALAGLAGQVFEPIGTATHYHTHAVNPYWASSLDYLGAIGAHRFYRWKGSAGQPGAFRNAYFGGEPVAAPAYRPGQPVLLASGGRGVSPPPNSALGNGKVADIPVGAARGSAPMPAADSLPQKGAIKPQYERSGRWIRQPG